MHNPPIEVFIAIGPLHFKIPKQEYTAEFKELAIRCVKDGQGIGPVARDLGLVEPWWPQRCRTNFRQARRVSGRLMVGAASQRGTTNNVDVIAIIVNCNIEWCWGRSSSSLIGCAEENAR